LNSYSGKNDISCDKTVFPWFMVLRINTAKIKKRDFKSKNQRTYL